MQRLYTTLNIRPGEGALVGLLLLFAMCMGFPTLVTETAAYSLFLVEFNAQAIPYIYIGFAIIATTNGFIYTWLESRIPFARFVTLNLTILFFSYLLLWLLIHNSTARWPIAILPMWYETAWAFANLGFWSLITHLLDVRQGKRLFALIGTGLSLSEVSVGFFIPSIINLIGIKNLLLISALGFGGALIVQSYILHRFTHIVVAEEESEDDILNPQASGNSLRDLFNHPYIALIFSFALFHVLADYVLDNAFYDRLETQYPDPEHLASFLGLFFAATGVMDIIGGAFVSGRYLNHYGLRTSLLTMPGMLMVGTVGIIFFGSFNEAMSLLFWIVISTKLTNEVLAYTINRASWQVLYEPLPANQRLRAQTVVESMISPVASGLAGLILLGLNQVVTFSAVQYGYVLVILLLSWMWVIIKLSRYYPKMLQQAISKRQLSDTPHVVSDEETLTVLEEGLHNANVGVVIYSLNTLAEIDPQRLIALLPRLLQHEDEMVRLEALRRIESLQLTAALPAVRQLLDRDTTSEIWGMALCTLAALSPPDVFGEISAYMQIPNLDLKQGAMVGLLRNQQLTPAQHEVVSQHLTALVDSLKPAERKFAAQVVAQLHDTTFHEHLKLLLQDEYPRVREAAILAAQQLRNPDLWPLVAQNLRWLPNRPQAVSALLSGGETVFPALEGAFEEFKQHRDILRRLIYICGSLGGQPAVALLLPHLHYPDEEIRTMVILALSQSNYQAHGEAKTAITDMLMSELAIATNTLAGIADFEENTAYQLLKRALYYKLSRHLLRIFRLLSFIYKPNAMLQAWQILQQPEIDSRQRAYAVELIDITVEAELKPLLLPLIEHTTIPPMLTQLQQHFPQTALHAPERLKMIIITAHEWTMPWVKACAFRTAAQLNLTRLAITTRQAMSAPDPLIRESAIWAFAALNQRAFKKEAARLAQDSHPHIQQVVQWLNTHKEGDVPMLSLVERVIFLKGVDIFSETPPEILSEIALILREVHYLSHTPIITKGETGSSLYIIINGEAKVHDGQREFYRLTGGDVFGELALLDEGARSASVTATEPTHLLRLDQENFYELMAARSEIGRGIIRVLVKRLRTTTEQVLENKP